MIFKTDNIFNYIEPKNEARGADLLLRSPIVYMVSPERFIPDNADIEELRSDYYFKIGITKDFRQRAAALKQEHGGFIAEFSYFRCFTCYEAAQEFERYMKQMLIDSKLKGSDECFPARFMYDVFMNEPFLTEGKPATGWISFFDLFWTTGKQFSSFRPISQIRSNQLATISKENTELKKELEKSQQQYSSMKKKLSKMIMSI